MILMKFLQDDKNNYSITRLGFFLILLLIVCLSIYIYIVGVTALKLYGISILIGFDLSLVGIKNWKDIIQKIK